MKEPIRILSDLHLGHSASRIKKVEMLRPLIEGAGTVVFNGDTWQELSHEGRQRGAVLLKELDQMCQEMEVETIYLPGNHDPSIGSRHALELSNGKVVIFHGDTVYPEVSPWSQHFIAMRGEVMSLIERHDLMNMTFDERAHLAQQVVRLMTPHKGRRKSVFRYLTDTLWPPSRLWTLLTLPLHYQGATARFSHQYFPNAEVIITGHFHLRSIVKRDGKCFINTGAHMLGCHSQVVEIMNDQIFCMNIVHYRRGVIGFCSARKVS